MGSDVYAYFSVQGEAARSKDLEALAADTGQDMTSVETLITARLDAAAKVAADHEADLWYDTSKMHVFDANSGAKLTSDQPVSA
jgi:multiple sugar transport system ATP-binding protein